MRSKKCSSGTARNLVIPEDERRRTSRSGFVLKALVHFAMAAVPRASC
jgi:hypothetical protein